MDDCLFCRIVAGEIPSRQVYADDTAIAFLDINPWHVGHSLVIPRRHVADLTSDATALTEIAPAISATASLLIDRLGADGLNLLSSTGATAGQEVFHFHVHLVPRYAHRPGLRELMVREPGIDLDRVYAQLIQQD
ncbi:MAG: HIT domain-containing protein [Propionicimonas sp.]|uniref:HIT family protein n=1 Tax=Propionicimonas sp. TaxID=1955623 RepID=UPI002B200DB0|nr:HIT domain-containing protein [Propionicimonas sp.]MEA4944055.1 HIT domain-containing protein [Propionicimonas sp.]MEA5116521.1 HIT domain-containing protein [Propionicimonas sp.]